MHPVLITGATGVVGGGIATLLAREKTPVRALVRNPARAQALLPEGVELILGDVTDPRSVRRATEGCSAVFHAAGLPEQWRRDERDFYRINAQGTENVARAALDAQVDTFVHTSTIDVFRRTPGVPFGESDLDDKPQATPYERSKQAADLAVRRALDDGLPARFIHPAAVYGPAPVVTPGMNEVIARIAANRAPALPPGGLPLVYSLDCALGHLSAAVAPVGARYILSDRFVTLTELTKIIQSLNPGTRLPPALPTRAAGWLSYCSEMLSKVTRSAPILPAGQFHVLKSHILPDSSRVRKELGWSATDLTAGIAATLEHFGLLSRQGPAAAWSPPAVRARR
ncbi:NAD-dependent epimerase/dehydratase family protein [Streptomyces sp. NPDC048489]|uniref:NAD-dependent epimerase/dehydratase family protein n=1 Tax=Streptomyces sp. NPDC048489 TaxID=3154504 RepID=UPI0034344C7D